MRTLARILSLGLAPFGLSVSLRREAKLIGISNGWPIWQQGAKPFIASPERAFVCCALKRLALLDCLISVPFTWLKWSDLRLSHWKIGGLSVIPLRNQCEVLPSAGSFVWSGADLASLVVDPRHPPPRV